MSVNGFRKYSAKEGETEVKTCFKCDGPGVWLLKFNKNTNAGVCVCNGDCLRELEQKKHPRCAGCGFPKELSSREEKVWFLFNRYCGVDHSCGGMLFSQDPAVSVFHGQHPFFASCLKAPQPEEKKATIVSIHEPENTACYYCCCHHCCCHHCCNKATNFCGCHSCSSASSSRSSSSTESGTKGT